MASCSWILKGCSSMKKDCDLGSCDCELVTGGTDFMEWPLYIVAYLR